MNNRHGDENAFRRRVRRALDIVERELRLRGLVAGRVCEVSARGWRLDYEDSRPYLEGR